MQHILEMITSLVKELYFYHCPFVVAHDFKRTELEGLFKIELLFEIRCARFDDFSNLHSNMETSGQA